MRFMLIVKASDLSESGALPGPELLAAMDAYNNEMLKAGILLAADGLQASSKGARVRFSGGKTTVIDGPFTETKELIAGFWLIQVKSLDEAIEWARRCPAPMGGHGRAVMSPRWMLVLAFHAPVSRAAAPVRLAGMAVARVGPDLASTAGNRRPGHEAGPGFRARAGGRPLAGAQCRR